MSGAILRSAARLFFFIELDADVTATLTRILGNAPASKDHSRTRVMQAAVQSAGEMGAASETKLMTQKNGS